MKKTFKNLFNSETSLFALSSGFKLAGIFVVGVGLISYMLWLVLSMNIAFFESNGYMVGEALREAYFDHVLRSVGEVSLYLFGFVVALFFGGILVSKMLLRPFKVIADYCDKKVEGLPAEYNPDNFSDFKLLTRFTDFFFQYLDEAARKGELRPNTIPPQFLGIHKPVFDKVFFFHFLCIILIIAVVAVTTLNMTFSSMQEDIADLAVKTLKGHGYGISHFLQEQAKLFASMNIAAGIFLFGSYSLLAIHLYGKVSGAIFGFFSTMRAFMKGDTKARVRLLGYNHIRPHGRSFNRYLKYVESEISGEEKSRNKQLVGLKYENV